MNRYLLQAFFDELEKIALSAPGVLKFQKQFMALRGKVRPFRDPEVFGLSTPRKIQTNFNTLAKTEELDKLLSEGKITKEEALARLKMNSPPPSGPTGTQIFRPQKSKEVTKVLKTPAAPTSGAAQTNVKMPPPPAATQPPMGAPQTSLGPAPRGKGPKRPGKGQGLGWKKPAIGATLLGVGGVGGYAAGQPESPSP